ncbi:MAG: hypothetical protein D4R84_12840 [Rhodocyclaceae bacterium]|nr:MAG: hypothetical protein D4R84_12840 [Rhodocyclaceae bacterium]
MNCEKYCEAGTLVFISILILCGLSLHSVDAHATEAEIRKTITEINTLLKKYGPSELGSDLSAVYKCSVAMGQGSGILTITAVPIANGQSRMISKANIEDLERVGQMLFHKNISVLMLCKGGKRCVKVISEDGKEEEEIGFGVTISRNDSVADRLANEFRKLIGLPLVK